MSTEAHSFAVRQEEDTVASGHVIAAVGLWAVLGAAGVAVAAVLVAGTVGSLRPSAAGPHGPALATRTISGIEQTPIRDVKAGVELRDRQLEQLDRWGWVDRDAGIARIPIDRAMDLVVSEERP